jgi:hypothetical protein
LLLLLLHRLLLLLLLLRCCCCCAAAAAAFDRKPPHEQCNHQHIRSPSWRQMSLAFSLASHKPEVRATRWRRNSEGKAAASSELAAIWRFRAALQCERRHALSGRQQRPRAEGRGRARQGGRADVFKSPE